MGIAEPKGIHARPDVRQRCDLIMTPNNRNQVALSANTQRRYFAVETALISARSHARR